METLDQLVETVMDVCYAERNDDGAIIIRDRIEKHFRPLHTALLRAKATIRTWHGETGWELYDKHSPEMMSINNALLHLQGSCDLRESA